MKRFETTARPSFTPSPTDRLLDVQPGVRWQVLCGDEGHWRLGMYSPAEASAADCQELERHDCPELFVLISGRMTLLCAEGGALKEIPLEQGKPLLVTVPHNGFCPDGPHTGVAMVVERDAFETEYRPPAGWL
jgi:hypothetical protein